MTSIPDLRAWLRPRLLELRIRYWTWRGALIVARETRAQERERHLRIERQLTASLATTTLSTGNARHRKRSLGR